MKSTLVRNAVDNFLHGANDLMKLFPLATVKFTWVPGVQNCADSLTKMKPDGIDLCNSDFWRSGSEIVQSPDENYKNTFLQIDGESGVQFFGLPKRLPKLSRTRQNFTWQREVTNLILQNT